MSRGGKLRGVITMTITKMGENGRSHGIYNNDEESETCIRDTEIEAGGCIFQSLSLYKQSVGSLAQ